MKDLDIYEVEYSCSPGGSDKWEIQERGGDFFQGDFDTAKDAISYALLKFNGEELNFNIKSLELMRSEEANKIRNEIVEKTNSILNDYKDLVLRFWDLYDEMEQEEQDLINKLGADKWFKYAFTLSLDELWHEAGNWQIVKEDLKDEREGE
jgi:hypothetical protein